MVLGQAEGDRDGEDDAQVVQDGGARGDEDGGGDVLGTPALRVDPVADTHEEGGDRHDGDGTHEGAAQLLQGRHRDVSC